MKEIHFYTNLCNEEQIPDKYVTDVLVDWVSTKKAIDDSSIEVVRTTQLSFLRGSWDFIDRGYKVFLHNSNWTVEVKEHMDIPGVEREYTRDIRKGHDLSRMFIGGTFGNLE